MVDRRSRVIDLFLRDGQLDSLILLIGNSDVHLVGRFAAADGESVALAGDGLAG